MTLEQTRRAEWVGAEYRDQVHTQTYAGRARIDGVQLIDLRVFSDEGGDFCELTRFEPDGTLSLVPGYRPAQISHSLMEPGTIKALHLHELQDDLWFVAPQDRLLVGLLDVREASPTYEMQMRLVLGAGKGRLLLIPKGVAHGVANLSPLRASIIYFTNRAFDESHPDEHRLPYDLLGADFWTIRPG
ncbi:MAG TPA: dTDP-4-dehydrorhamnose 3,5-epimerase family protein [Chloroflexota bacterium]